MSRFLKHFPVMGILTARCVFNIEANLNLINVRRWVIYKTQIGIFAVKDGVNWKTRKEKKLINK